MELLSMFQRAHHCIHPQAPYIVRLSEHHEVINRRLRITAVTNIIVFWSLKVAKFKLKRDRRKVAVLG